MRNKDVFRFKIVEETSAELCDDLKTVRKSSLYYLYKKVSWFLGGWKNVLNDKTYFPEFYSAEDARLCAHRYVKREVENRKRVASEKNLKNELKTTVKIVTDFKIDADS